MSSSPMTTSCYCCLWLLPSHQLSSIAWATRAKKLAYIGLWYMSNRWKNSLKSANKKASELHDLFVSSLPKFKINICNTIEKIYGMLSSVSFIIIIHNIKVKILTSTRVILLLIFLVFYNFRHLIIFLLFICLNINLEITNLLGFWKIIQDKYINYM